MKNLISLLFCVIVDVCSFSQNLVPNPSFEEYSLCPDFPGEVDKLIGWWQPTIGTADYFNSCSEHGDSYSDVPRNIFGYQNPQFGNGYVGLLAAFYFVNQEEYREYIQCKLISPLISGNRYFVSFYICLADSSNWATDDFGVYFSADSLYSSSWSNLNFQPQIENNDNYFLTDKNNWIKITGNFIAHGNENYLTIGNFKNNDNTDSLKVTNGGNLNIGDYYTYYYIDDICLSSDSLTCNNDLGMNEEESLFSIYPNPSNKNFIIDLKNDLMNEITVVNSIGKLIYKDVILSKSVIYCEDWTPGIYIIQINNSNFKTKLIISP